MAWLLYPVDERRRLDALALPGDRAGARPARCARASAALAAAVGLVLLGGQVQMSAHVLLAVAAYAGWRLRPGAPIPAASGPWLAWGVGMALGVALGAIEVVPLGVYLTRSPVWTDRAAEKRSAWAIERPRLLDAAPHRPALRVREPAAGPAEPGEGPRGAEPERGGGGVRGAGDAPLAGAAGVVGAADELPARPVPGGAGGPRGAGGVRGRAGGERPAGDPRAGRDRQPPADPLAGLRPGPARRGSAWIGSTAPGRPGVDGRSAGRPPGSACWRRGGVRAVRGPACVPGRSPTTRGTAEGRSEPELARFAPSGRCARPCAFVPRYYGLGGRPPARPGRPGDGLAKRADLAPRRRKVGARS